MDSNKNQESLEQIQGESDISKEIGNMVSHRASQCRNSVLSTQIQKVLPAGAIVKKGSSLHMMLQKVSEESQKKPKADQKRLTIQIPKQCINTLEGIDEYVIVGSENKLLTDSFVQSLAVPIQEKRKYRKSIIVSFERKPWTIKVQNYMKKKFENCLSWFDLWHDILNAIEGRHGTAVMSYFLFIRWLLYMNIMIFSLNFFFLVLPQLFFTGVQNANVNLTISYFTQNSSSAHNEILEPTFSLNKDATEMETYSVFSFLSSRHMNHSEKDITNASSIYVITNHCHELYLQQIANDTQTGFFAAVQNFLQGTGPLEKTLLFTGFYSPSNVTPLGPFYDISWAFLCILLATFVGCFVMMIHYSSIGIEEYFKIQNEKYSFYSNRVFSDWEYCIKELTSAELLRHQLVLELKTSMSEDRAKRQIITRSTKTWKKLYTIRFCINVFVVMWLFACCSLIYSATAYQMSEQQKHLLSEPGLRNFFIQFLSSIMIIILNSISPTVFKLLVSFEKYSAQTEADLSVFRNVFLYLSSLIVLLNTFYQQVACKPKDICGAGLNLTCRSPRCWETYVGQQLFKLTVTDLFVYIAVFCCNDVVKYYVHQNCDNKFTRLWGMPVFFLPTEVLTVINSQTFLWLGVFYSPLLPAVMILKLIIIFYIKKTKILKFVEPSECSYHASRFNAVFILILLISFFVVLIVQSYAIEGISPSRGCGPFRYLNSMIKAVPDYIRSWLSILTSYWTILFTMVILGLLMNYYWRVLIFQKKLAERLKVHIVLQSYDKQFLLKSISELTGDQTSTEKL